jgi:hypothetical protein
VVWIGVLLAILVSAIAAFSQLVSENPLEIGVIGNSGDSPETYKAIEYFVNKRVARVNDHGGINGRKLVALFRDNKGDNSLAEKQVSELVERDNLIALVGIWNSSRAERVMPIIESADVPLIGYFSDTKIYRDDTDTYCYRNRDGECEHKDASRQCQKVTKDHPGIYTGIIGLRDESKVFKRRLAQADVGSVIYLGQRHDRYSREYLQSLDEIACSGLIDGLRVFTVTSASGSGTLHTWSGAGECVELEPEQEIEEMSFDAAIRDAAIAELLERQLALEKPDMIVLSLGSVDNARIVERLSEQRAGVIVYSALGDIGNIIGNLRPDLRGHEGVELWDTADQGIPHANNQRLEELYANSRDELASSEVTKNVIGFGGIYSDLAAMIAEAANTGESTEPSAVRSDIVKGMEDYRQGGKIFQGWANDWWFTVDRSAARDSRLAWSPSGRSTYVLDPVQFTFVGRELVPADVLFTSIDVIEFRGLDDRDGEVDVEFYLGIKKAISKSGGTTEDPAMQRCWSASNIPSNGGGPASGANSHGLINYLSFPNAAKSKLNQAPLLDHRRLSRDIESSDGFTFCNELYQVSGRFAFQPDLRDYPFDQQTIQISMQASDNEKPVLIQPLALELQDKEFRSPNWKRVQHYVGVDQDIIKSLSGYGENVQVIPFYRFNFTWIMKREFVEYGLKVILPVLFICLITYASVFIPTDHFEATAGIQVTSLPAAIALYFSIDKPSTSYATLSDWVFVLTYVTITSMLVLSVTHAVAVSRNIGILTLPVRFLQILGYPLWVLLVVVFLSISTTGP